MKTNFKTLAALLASAVLSACGAGSNTEQLPPDVATSTTGVTAIPGSAIEMAPAQAPVSVSAPIVAVRDTHTPAGTVPPDLPAPPPSMAPPCPPEVCLQTPYNELEHPAMPKLSASGDVMVGYMGGASADERPYPDLSNLPAQSAP